MDAITPVLALPLTRPIPNKEPTDTWVVETGIPELAGKNHQQCRDQIGRQALVVSDGGDFMTHGFRHSSGVEYTTQSASPSPPQ